jgi:squalene-hopene/tetraprenyl-beta-curcumene cyclase
MPSRLAAILALVLLPGLGLGADWDPRLAAEYLDARQKAWFAWPTANEDPGGPCLSCHTGLTYLLARPALRNALGETAPTPSETGLLDAVRRRLPLDSPSRFAPREKEPLASQVLGVEAVLSALLLADDDRRRGSLSREAEQAFDRLWALQVRAGKAKGGWHWNSLGLDPWEEPDSAFFGASLAALAVGVAPSNYQQRPGIRAQRDDLAAYLQSRQQGQPLHNRLMLAWASTHLPSVLSESDRKVILDDALRRQQPDGGWTIESLGPWPEHPRAPRSQGSHAYATGLVAFVLQRAGVPESNPGLHRALGWLRARQDPQGGFWEAPSMNKEYDPGSMPLHFMRDAATAFATLALMEAR